MKINVTRLFCVLLTIIMLFTLAACGTKNHGDSVPSESQTIPEDTEPQETPREGEDIDEWEYFDETQSEPAIEEDETVADPTEPEEEIPPVTDESTSSGNLTYEQYMALSAEQQQAHFESFPSLDAYIAWYNAALAEYEANQNIVEATGPIDIGDYMNP